MSFNNIINNILLSNMYDCIINKFEIIFKVMDNKELQCTYIINSINKIFSYIFQYNNNKYFVKEDDYIYPLLKKSNSIIRIKDMDDLIDDGPIEI